MYKTHKKSAKFMRIFLVKNCYLQFFAEEFDFELALFDVDSFEASTFLVVFVIFEDFFDLVPTFEFLPNIFSPPIFKTFLSCSIRITLL